MSKFAAVSFAGLSTALVSLAGCMSDTAADCVPGTLQCECHMGLCQEGLVCASNYCVDPNGGSGSGGTDDGPDDTDTDDTDTDDTGPDDCIPPQVVPITPQSPAAACLPGIPCVTDQNCEAGQVCNVALDPPECETIYCGQAGTTCHDDAVCASKMSCHGGLCKPCDICGDECEVNFLTDTQHCGCCDNPAPAGGSCTNGQTVCPNGLTNCSGACVDLLSDSKNCGTCGNAVGYEAECVNGMIDCYYSNATLCGNDCVDIGFTDHHCGACGVACPDNSYGCSSGQCRVLWYDRMTCTEGCAQAGMGCDPSGDHKFGVEGGCGSTTHSLAGCDTLPPTTGTCGSSGACTCDFDYVYCECIV